MCWDKSGLNILTLVQVKSPPREFLTTVQTLGSFQSCLEFGIVDKGL